MTLKHRSQDKAEHGPPFPLHTDGRGTDWFAFSESSNAIVYELKRSRKLFPFGTALFTSSATYPEHANPPRCTPPPPDDSPRRSFPHAASRSPPSPPVL